MSKGRGGEHHDRRSHNGGRDGGRHGEHHGPRHGGRGGHFKYCIAASAGMYSAVMAIFIGVFKKFTMVFKSLDNVQKMEQQSRAMSIDQRNAMYRSVTEGTKKSRKAMKKQVGDVTYSYVPPCVAPNMDNAVSQRQVLIGEPEPDCENVAAAPVRVVAQEQPRPQQATYTLEQVKELLELERQRLG